MKDKAPFIVVMYDASQGGKTVSGTKLFTVEEFFRRITNPYTRAYTILPDSGEAPKFITKDRLKNEFQEFAQSEYYQGRAKLKKG